MYLDDPIVQGLSAAHVSMAAKRLGYKIGLD
jgi:hypothetical protein